MFHRVQSRVTVPNDCVARVLGMFQLGNTAVQEQAGGPQHWMRTVVMFACFGSHFCLPFCVPKLSTMWFWFFHNQSPVWEMLRTPSVCQTPCLTLGMQAWSPLGTASVRGEGQMVLQDTVRLWWAQDGGAQRAFHPLNTSVWRVSQTGVGAPLEGFLEEELSDLDLEGFMPEGQSGGFYKQKKQRLAKLGGKRKCVLFEELEVWWDRSIAWVWGTVVSSESEGWSRTRTMKDLTFLFKNLDFDPRAINVKLLRNTYFYVLSCLLTYLFYQVNFYIKVIHICWKTSNNTEAYRMQSKVPFPLLHSLPHPNPQRYLLLSISFSLFQKLSVYIQAHTVYVCFLLTQVEPCHTKQFPGKTWTAWTSLPTSTQRYIFFSVAASYTFI